MSRPMVFKMVSAGELLNSSKSVGANMADSDKQYIRQLETELETMRRMVSELQRREPDPPKSDQRSSGEHPSATRASPSSLFAQELERMESGGYVPSRSHLDSPVKSNAVGGKGVQRVGSGRRTRRQSRSNVTATRTALVLHSVRVKRELLNLKAGLGSVRAGGKALASTLGRTQMASALGVLSNEVELESPEPEPEPEPDAQPAQPQPQLLPRPNQGLDCVAESESQVRLPQIGPTRAMGLHEPVSNASPSARSQRSHAEGRGGARGTARECTNQARLSPFAGSTLVSDEASTSPSLPSVHRHRNKNGDRGRRGNQNVKSRRKQRRPVDTSPVFERHASPSPTERNDEKTKHPSSGRARRVDRKLDCFLVPAGKPVRRRHRKPFVNS